MDNVTTRDTRVYLLFTSERLLGLDPGLGYLRNLKTPTANEILLRSVLCGHKLLKQVISSEPLSAAVPDEASFQRNPRARSG